MPWDSLLAFASISLALALSPGPSWAYVLSAASDAIRPYRSASAAILGNAAGIAAHVTLAVGGVTLLADRLPAILTAIRWAGAAYLLYLGVKLLRRGALLEPSGVAPSTILAVGRGGFLVNLLNPKVSLLMLALLPQFVRFDEGDVAIQVALLGSIHILLATCVLSALAATAIRAGRWFGERSAANRILPRLSGAALIGFGVHVAISQR